VALRRPGQYLAALLTAVASGGALVAGPARAADEPKALIKGVDDKDLRDRMETAVGRTGKASESGLQARRRAEDAASQVVEVLRSEGYYDYDVEPTISEDDPPKAIVRVTPGPRFKIGATDVEWLRAPTEPATKADAERAIGLKPGQPGRAADVVAAEGRIIASLDQHGYPDAKAEPRKVIVDHATLTVDPTYNIDAGALVRLDGIELQSTGRTRKSWIDSLIGWKPGHIYDPQHLAELERRLRETQVYQSVTVALAPPDKTLPNGERPVVVSLADRSRATIEAGVGYSSSEGFGLDAVYSRFNMLGRADTFSVLARVAEIERKLGVQISLPQFRRPDYTLVVGSDVYQELQPAYNRDGVDLRADMKKRLGKYSFYHYGLTLEADHNLETAFIPHTDITHSLDLRLGMVTGIAGIVWDNSDDPLNPTRGWRLIADAAPTFVTGDEQLTFVRAVAQGSVYYSVIKDGGTVLAARLRLGSILNGSIPEVPSDRRFYAGGGGSVRGYDYQGIGPHFPNGVPEGGLGLVETSFEVRQHIKDAWGAVAFVDAGSVSESPAPDFSHLRVGVGVGVRYLLKFAPVRADIAFPMDRSNGQNAFQLYVSIGQAF
jgi:translocation and assembly module TamA